LLAGQREKQRGSFQGAKKEKNCVYVNADLSKLAMGDSITIIATARTGYPFWFKLLLSISI